MRKCLLERLVAMDQTVVLVVDDEGLGDTFDGIGQPGLDLLGALLARFEIGIGGFKLMLTGGEAGIGELELAMLVGQSDLGYLWGIANDVAWQLDAI